MAKSSKKQDLVDEIMDLVNSDEFKSVRSSINSIQSKIDSALSSAPTYSGLSHFDLIFCMKFSNKMEWAQENDFKKFEKELREFALFSKYNMNLK